MTLFTLTLILFLVMDPLGNCRAFLDAMKPVPPERRRLVLLREHLIGLATILSFNFLGEYIFTYALDVHEVTIRIATGVILFLIAIRRLFPSDDSTESYPEGEPFVVPLAIPFTAGPSLLATVMLYAHQEPTGWTLLAAIFITWMAAVILHLTGPTLLKTLGEGSLTAFERMSGMFLILLGVQRFMDGVDLFWRVSLPL